MPATQIAQNLAFINWTVLTGLALGSYAAVVLLRRRTTATRGFLRFTTFCALGFGFLAWLSDGALPSSLGTSPVVIDPVWDAPRRFALGAFCVLLVAALVIGRMRPGWARAADLAAVAAGLRQDAAQDIAEDDAVRNARLATGRRSLLKNDGSLTTWLRAGSSFASATKSLLG